MSAMMDSSPSKTNTLPSLPPLSGTKKRPAPSLLPAFEPLSSSSPGFPRPSKRQARFSESERGALYTKYPTPIPTSTTGIISSSPPRPAVRPSLHRASTTERAPLSAVPSITLPENGDLLRMGRSSNSSHYQLSANRLISRVHVETRYIAATVPLEPNRVEIKCKGWNGIKLHCQGRTWELAKDDTFTSETEFADIMLDVQDARVLLSWPGQDRKVSVESQDWEEDSSSTHNGVSAVSSQGQDLESSPVRRDAQRIRSPVSPTPAGVSNSKIDLKDLFSSSVEPEQVKVFEDAPSPEKREEEDAGGQSFATTQAATSFRFPMVSASQDSDLSEPEEDEDPDEENDPIVHSFGPFGANISGRMASFTTNASPAAARRDVYASSKATAKGPDPIPIINHVVNQLAYSRLSSTPLSVILNNLPANLKVGATPDTKLTKEALRQMLLSAPASTSCIGEIHREGKDAAGKALESEYYYIPDNDTDEGRRAAVVNTLGKPSLRNCRKQHKQYYWKKPRTP